MSSFQPKKSVETKPPHDSTQEIVSTLGELTTPTRKIDRAENQEMSSLFHAVALASNQIHTESMQHSNKITGNGTSDANEEKYAALLLGSLSSTNKNIETSTNESFAARDNAVNSIGRPPLPPNLNSTSSSMKPRKRQKTSSPTHYHSLSPSKSSHSYSYSSPDSDATPKFVSSKFNHTPETPKNSRLKNQKNDKISTPSNKSNQKDLQHRRAIPTSSQSQKSHASSTSINQTRPKHSDDTTKYYHTQWDESWDDLPIGKTIGSVALNNYFQYQAEQAYYQMKNAKYIHPNSYKTNDMMEDYDENLSVHVPKVSAREALQILNSLRVKTSLPPKNSDLHRIVQKSRFENQKERLTDASSKINLEKISSDSDDTDASMKKPSPITNTSKVTTKTNPNNQSKKLSNDPKLLCFQKSIEQLYETICSQDTDDGITYRREARHFSASDIVEKFQSLETQATLLQQREQEIWNQGEKARRLLYGPQKSEEKNENKDIESLRAFTKKKAYYMGYRFGKEDVDKWMRFSPPKKESSS